MMKILKSNHQNTHQLTTGCSCKDYFCNSKYEAADSSVKYLQTSVIWMTQWNNRTGWLISDKGNDGISQISKHWIQNEMWTYDAPVKMLWILPYGAWKRHPFTSTLDAAQLISYESFLLMMIDLWFPLTSSKCTKMIENDSLI